MTREISEQHTIPGYDSELWAVLNKLFNLQNRQIVSLVLTVEMEKPVSVVVKELIDFNTLAATEITTSYNLVKVE